MLSIVGSLFIENMCQRHTLVQNSTAPHRTQITNIFDEN